MSTRMKIRAELPRLAYTPEEVGVIIGRSSDTVKRLIHRGEIKARVVSGEKRKTYVIPRYAVEEFLVVDTAKALPLPTTKKETI